MPTKTAVFRADASVRIATGHVRRCLTLADALKEKGSDTLFVSRELPGHLFDVIRERGHALIPLPGGKPDGRDRDDDGSALSQDADETARALATWGRACDWLIVDRYRVDRAWERSLRASVDRILVIDDLARTPHDCDVLLNEADWPEIRQTYAALVPSGARLLLGPRFALLRPVFAKRRLATTPRGGEVCRVLITYGGVDATNETAKAIEALSHAGRDLPIDIVLGPTNPHRRSIEGATAHLRGATVHVGLPHLADLMSEADLALAAGGNTVWELLCLGVPAFVTTTAENQVAGIRSLSERGLLRWLGTAGDVTVDRLTEALMDAVARPAQLRALSEAGRRHVDGLGAARCAAMLSGESSAGDDAGPLAPVEAGRDA